MKKKVLIGIIAGAVVLVGVVLGVIFITPYDDSSGTTMTTTTTTATTTTVTTTTTTTTTPTTPSPTITISNVVVSSDGSEVTFDVCIKNNPGIMNMLISMSVDDEVFGFKDAVKGSTLPSSTLTNPGPLVNASPYNFLFDAMEIIDDDKLDGVLFTVTLTVKDTSAIGNYDITFSYVEGDIVDENLEAVEIKIENNTITLK